MRTGWRGAVSRGPVCLAAAVLVGSVITLVGCSARPDAPPPTPVRPNLPSPAEPGGPSPAGAGTPAPSPTADPSAADTGPVVFAFRCHTATGTSTPGRGTRGGRGGVTLFTTDAAAWEARSDDCTAVRIAGSVPSEQQRAAVAAGGGAVTLRQLAGRCAEVGTGPFRGVVHSDRELLEARAVLRYCPGHPQIDRVRAAIAAYAG